ncbi:hypothetical protein [Marinobacter adhaerens]|uniref:hypothetical protein n=1 Tax=Marinobacter adhaerens TaxID=1033846 RepID=UPI00142897C0|nr:hypothetical protein [Marinobacter adhaerens]
MEKVWRPFSLWERRPVTPLNGPCFLSFREKSLIFVKECKILEKAATACQKNESQSTTAGQKNNQT